MNATTDRPTGFRKDVPLADLTTIGLGGNAKYYVQCRTVDEIRSALSYARSERLFVLILGGGSNVIFPDEGFDGLVLNIGLKGITIEDEGGRTSVNAAAGETWDDLVRLCVENNLAGVECLSGIPGSVGATPIQNVGAYGQEVKDTISSVKALDRNTLDLVEFPSADCKFAYRMSRFKAEDRDRFIIVEVDYRLERNGKPTLKYDELRKYIESGRTVKAEEEKGERGKGKGEPDLGETRSAVLALRRRKSMVADDHDPNSRSVGSFFINPILSNAEYAAFLRRLEEIGIGQAPSFGTSDGTKLSAAWLVENSGFKKGYRNGGAGISSNHALALVNYGGTTAELLSLAAAIEAAVFKKFGITLEKEAVVVGRVYDTGDSGDMKMNVTKSAF